MPEGLGQARPGNSHTLHWDWLLSSHSPVHPVAESSLVHCVLPPITSFHSFLGCLYVFGVCHWSCPWSLQDTSQLHRSDKTYETEVRVRSPTSQSPSSLMTQEGHPATWTEMHQSYVSLLLYQGLDTWSKPSQLDTSLSKQDFDLKQHEART